MSDPKSRIQPRSPWLIFGERFMTLLVLANLAVVVFDHTYIKARNWYLKTDIYLEQLKNTPQKQYLQKVVALQEELEFGGLQSPRVEELLGELRRFSIEIFIKNPPFRVVGRQGALGAIKSLFLSRIDESKNIEEALTTFWSEDYLEEKGWEQELMFFDDNIRILMLFYEPLLPYDFIKGIEPYRDSQKYLIAVMQLEEELEKTGLSGENVEVLLADLRDRSAELIDGDYFFQIVNRTSTLSEIKYRIKKHIYYRVRDTNPNLPRNLELLKSLNLLEYIAPEVLWAHRSSKEAFMTFWSVPNFTANGWEKELAFFNEEQKFLMRSFYFRSLGINGGFVNRFWLVDLPWVTLFWIEFLLRTTRISRRTSLSWWGAVKSRWYDVFLLQPWLPMLRGITTIIRLEQVQVLDMEEMRRYMGLNFIASFGKEITQVVVNRGIDQLQNTVGKGLIKRAILERKKQPPGTVISEANDHTMGAIANRVLEFTAGEVLPEVRPDLEDFLHYQVEKALQKSKIYRQLQRVPLIRRFPNQIADNIVAQISNAIAKGPQKADEGGNNGEPDPEGSALKQRLIQHFSTQFLSKLEEEETLDDIEFMLIDWLEAIKIKYDKPAEVPAIAPSKEAGSLKQILPAKD